MLHRLVFTSLIRGLGQSLLLEAESRLGILLALAYWWRLSFLFLEEELEKAEFCAFSS